MRAGDIGSTGMALRYLDNSSHDVGGVDGGARLDLTT